MRLKNETVLPGAIGFWSTEASRTPVTETVSEPPGSTPSAVNTTRAGSATPWAVSNVTGPPGPDRVK